MYAVPLSKRIRRTLGVGVGGDLALTLDVAPTAYFPAGLLAPQADNGLLDGAPRTSLSPWRLYWERPPAQLQACDRVEVDSETYELISKPRGVNNGRRVVGYSAPCLPVALLYPRSAELKEQGATEALATVECAIYSPRETEGQRASYVDTFFEAPPAAWQHFDGAVNIGLHFDDGSVWKVGDAELAPELPYVNGSVKKVR